MELSIMQIEYVYRICFNGVHNINYTIKSNILCVNLCKYSYAISLDDT